MRTTTNIGLALLIVRARHSHCRRRQWVSNGSVSRGHPVASDETLGVALSDYVKAPSLLADVRRDQRGSY